MLCLIVSLKIKVLLHKKNLLPILINLFGKLNINIKKKGELEWLKRAAIALRILAPPSIPKPVSQSFT